MGIKELNLEFESDEEKRKAADGALDIDVDLSFSANGDEEVKRLVPKPKPRVAPVKRADNTTENVRNINEARPQAVRPAGVATQNQVHNTQVSEDVAALKSEINLLRSEIQAIKQSSDVKLAVAEAEKNYLIEHVSNAKLMEHQVMQMLRSIHKKAPAAVGEVQNIKKYVQDFLEKTNPSKK